MSNFHANILIAIMLFILTALLRNDFTALQPITFIAGIVFIIAAFFSSTEVHLND